jgi:hypothetical protein
MTPEQMTTGMHNAGFTKFVYAEHFILFMEVNGSIILIDNYWPSDWGNPPSQATIDGW